MLDKKVNNKSCSGSAEEKADDATAGLNEELEAETVTKEAQGVEASRGGQRPAGHAQQGSSQSSPGKKLSLRERMALRGISTKK